MDIFQAYRTAAETFDLEALFDVAVRLIGQSSLELPHPERPDVLTQARSSARVRLGNVVYFSDPDGGNRWALVQVMNFIDGYVTEAGPVVLFDKKCEGVLTYVFEQIEAGEADAQWDRRDSYGGLCIGQTRPYHFFYDQAIHLGPLKERLGTDMPTLAKIDGGTYLDPEKICGWPGVPVEPGRYYLTPNVIGGTWWRSKTERGFFEAATRMEREVQARVPRLDLRYPEGAPIVWFGVTGQKRSWLDQVEGYARIANSLARQHPALVVLFDGLTAPDGFYERYAEDALIVEAISHRLEANVIPVSLVGHDYATKIAHGQMAQAFIANGGTGSVVPLRFCRLPGVLHSNSAINTFTGDTYAADVRQCDPELVHEVPHPENARGDWISYQIPWQHVHNQFIEVVEGVGLAVPKPLPLPRPENRTTSDFERFGALSKRIKPNHTSAHILRMIAGAFAQSGDNATAAAIYEKVLLLDPSDLSIRQYVNQRRSML